MYCQLCGNTEGGTASHTTKPMGHGFTPYAEKYVKAAESILQAAGSSLRHYMPATRLKIISTTETALEA